MQPLSSNHIEVTQKVQHDFLKNVHVLLLFSQVFSWSAFILLLLTWLVYYLLSPQGFTVNFFLQRSLEVSRNLTTVSLPIHIASTFVATFTPSLAPSTYPSYSPSSENPSLQPSNAPSNDDTFKVSSKDFKFPTRPSRNNLFEEYGMVEYAIPYAYENQTVITNRWANNRTHVRLLLDNLAKPMYTYVATIPRTGNTQLLYDLAKITDFLPDSMYPEKNFGKREKRPDDIHWHYLPSDPRAFGHKLASGGKHPIFCKTHNPRKVWDWNTTFGFLSTYREPLAKWDASRRCNQKLIGDFVRHGKEFHGFHHGVVKTSEKNGLILVYIPFETYVRNRTTVLHVLFNHVPAFKEIYHHNMEAKEGPKHPV